MYVCMHVCMYVCMYRHLYIYTAQVEHCMVFKTEVDHVMRIRFWFRRIGYEISERADGFPRGGGTAGQSQPKGSMYPYSVYLDPKVPK